MGILFKKLLRDLKDAKGQFAAILIVIIIGVMFYTGINATFKNLSGASIKYYEDYRFADIWASVGNAPEGIIDKITLLPYVKMSNGRVTKDVRISISDENAIVRLITLPDNKQDIVNDVAIKSGRYFSNDENNQCIVEEEFFKAHNLKIGDYIYPIADGKQIKLKVIGAAKSPEYVYVINDLNNLINDNRKFGIVYIKKSFGQTILGFNGAINDIAITVKPGTDIDNAKDDIAKILAPFGVIGIIDRSEQVSNSLLNQEIEGLESMGKAFPIIFFIVAAVIIYIMMGRMIENQRAQIGVLKALGYSNLKVLTHYMSYHTFFGVIGSIIGSIFGMYLGKGMTELENMYFHLPIGNIKIYTELAIPASLLILFFCMLAGYSSCKLAFKITPSEAMKPRAPKAGKKVLFERIKPLWNRLDINAKMAIRNVFRYKKRAALTAVGIILSTMVLFMGFGMRDSVNILMKRQYSDILNYDLKVNFSNLIAIEEINRLNGIEHIESIEPMAEVGVRLSNGYRTKDVGLIALIGSPELYKVVDSNGESVPIPDNGAMIPAKLGRILGVNPGDSIRLRPYLPNKAEKRVIVDNLIEQYIGMNVYANIENINYLLGEGGVFNSAVLRIESGAYEEQVKDELNKMSFVSSVHSKAEAVENLNENMKMLTSFYAVIIILAAVLCTAVVYNITTINIFERKRELATLKVLGQKDCELRKVVFGENYIVGAISIIVALPLGRLFDGYLSKTIYETDMYTMPVAKSVNTYIMTVILMLIFTALANAVLRKKIRNINIVEVLKSNE